MVAGSGYDACWENRRYALAAESASWTGNAKSIPRSPSILANPLFASFGLFAPRNLTSAVTLTLCALAVAGAFGMILELERGFGGLIHISPQPMLQAVKTLDAEATANGLTADIAPSAFGAPRGLQ